MGNALYIEIKDKPDDFDSFMNGKDLARAWDALNVIAAIINVPTIDKLCNNAWKNPDKGLPIFQKYLDYIKENPTSVENSNYVIEDLEDVLRLIGEAKNFSSKWRLWLDY
ncbi:MAG: hypothetical protein Q7S87_00685 [Agitococcus sp.]|nr:hypothetical protein [Agitococcus sp.]